MAEKVVVAGAGFSGISSALKLSRKGYEVVLLDKNEYFAYNPGLIDVFRDRLFSGRMSMNLEDFFSNTGVEFSREKVLGVDTGQKIVETDSSSYSYDYLVVALGGEPRSFGMNISVTEDCYSFEAAEEMAEKVEDAESAVIVGSGYVGVEIAGELAEKGLEVTVADAATRPMPNSNTEASEIVVEYFNSKDISFRGGKKAVEVSEESVEFDDEEVIEADIVVWSGGVQALETVQQSFDCDLKGLDVNSGLSSPEFEGVFASGDAAADGSLKTAHNAMEQAEVIAENVDKEMHEELEEFKEGMNPLLISVGDTAIFEYGDKAYGNRFFRLFKDLVRVRYWTVIWRQKWKSKLF